MDSSKPWQPSPHFDPYDIVSLAEENDRLRRALCATTRDYIQTKKELESAREALGYGKKPLPFLQLPREVRDQIYSYALQTAVNIRPEFHDIHSLSLQHSPWKPESPAICLVNRQIYVEAMEILYSKNTFCFSNPSELLSFEDQIGIPNRDLVQRIEIPMVVMPESVVIPDLDLGPPCDWRSIPAHWAKALMKSSFNHILEISITVEDLRSSNQNQVVIPPTLQHAIEDVFHRSQDQESKLRLVLKGFSNSEWRKFPKHWEIKTENWEDFEEAEDAAFVQTPPYRENETSVE